MFASRSPHLYPLYVVYFLLLTFVTTAPAPVSTVEESIQLNQPSENGVGFAALAPYVQNATAPTNITAQRPGYRYKVPGTNTWLKFRFHGARKIDRKSLYMTLVSAMDEAHTDIRLFGAATRVNEKQGPFHQHTPGCMFTISSTSYPDKERKMTYSMRMEAVVGLYNVLYKAKREEASEFLVYYEGVGLVGVGMIDKERRIAPN